MTKEKPAGRGPTISDNRKAFHDYFIEERFEAGLMLKGWEVKSMRAGRTQIKEGYVHIRNGEAWLEGMHLAPLPQASTHVETNPVRARKLLLHARELEKLIGLTERRGYTLVPLTLYWKDGRAKIEIGLGKGKKQYDKRESLKKHEDEREQQRAMRGKR